MFIHHRPTFAFFLHQVTQDIDEDSFLVFTNHWWKKDKMITNHCPQNHSNNCCWLDCHAKLQLKCDISWSTLVFQNALVIITLRTSEGGFGSILNSATTTNSNPARRLQIKHAAMVLALSPLRKISTKVEQPVLYMHPLASWSFLGWPGLPCQSHDHLLFESVKFILPGPLGLMLMHISIQ